MAHNALDDARTRTVYQHFTALGGQVVDVCAELPRHPYRTYADRPVDGLAGLCVHQALVHVYDQRGLRTIAANHVSSDPKRSQFSGGAPGLAYHAAIAGDGSVLVAWPLSTRTWSQGGGSGGPSNPNTTLVGVVVLGCFPPGRGGGHPMPGQVLALLRLWQAFREVYGWAPDALWTHAQLGKPACPGEALSGLVEALRSGSEQLPWTPPGGLPAVEYHRWRQGALSGLGYHPGALDGQWGPQSKAALMACQADANLPATGVWSPAVEAVVLDRYRALAGAVGRSG